VQEDAVGRALGQIQEERNAYMLMVGEPEENRSLGSPRHRWLDNIKMDVRKLG
jgi:hypothetical protein